jgi:hypothetical protein
LENPSCTDQDGHHKDFPITITNESQYPPTTKQPGGPKKYCLLSFEFYDELLTLLWSCGGVCKVGYYSKNIFDAQKGILLFLLIFFPYKVGALVDKKDKTYT